MTALSHESDIPLYCSSVAILETPGEPGGPNQFLLEQRPNLEHTNMANPGTMQLFGGHKEKGHTFWWTLGKELCEEVCLPPDELWPSPEGLERSQYLNASLLGIVPWQAARLRPREGGDPELLVKHFEVALHHVWVPRSFGDIELSARERERGTEVGRIPATLEAVEQARTHLAVFSYRALKGLLTDKPMQGNMHEELVVAGKRVQTGRSRLSVGAVQ
jgi:hypothetical protein